MEALHVLGTMLGPQDRAVNDISLLQKCKVWGVTGVCVCVCVEKPIVNTRQQGFYTPLWELESDKERPPGGRYI